MMDTMLLRWIGPPFYENLFSWPHGFIWFDDVQTRQEEMALTVDPFQRRIRARLCGDSGKWPGLSCPGEASLSSCRPYGDFPKLW